MDEDGIKEYLAGRSIAELLQKKQVLEPFTSMPRVKNHWQLVMAELSVRADREVDFLKRMGEAQCQKPETS